MGIGASEIERFHRSLATLCRDGAPLGRALEHLAMDLDRGPLRATAEALSVDVVAGASLAEAYRRRAKGVPPLYAALIEAGLASGDLPGALEEIARHSAFRAEVRARLRGALASPVITAAVIATVGALLLLQVGPAASVASLEAAWDLYSPERSPFHVLGPALAGGVTLSAAFAAVLYVVSIVRSPFGPLPGSERDGETRGGRLSEIRRSAALASLAAALAIGLRRSLPLGAALELAGGATDDPHLRDRVEAMVRSAREGSNVSGALEAGGVVPSSLIWLIAAAEGRGVAESPGDGHSGAAVAVALDRIAAIYRDRLASTADAVLSAIGPLAQLALGIVVLAFAATYWMSLYPLMRLAGGSGE